MQSSFIRSSNPFVQVIFCALIGLVLATLVAAALSFAPARLNWDIVRQILTSSALFLVPPLILLRMRGESPYRAWRLVPNSKGLYWLAGVIVLPGLLSLGEATTIYFIEMANPPEWWVSLRELQAQSTDFLERIFEASVGTQLAGFIMIAIIAPLGEEFFFRGTVQRMLSDSLPSWASITITSVLFTLVHLQIDNAVAILFLAIALGILYHRTQSLWVVILGHMVFNALNFAIQLEWVIWPTSILWLVASALIALLLLIRVPRLPATPIELELPKPPLDTSEE